MTFTKDLFKINLLIICFLVSCEDPGNSNSYANREKPFNENWQFRPGDSVANPHEVQWRILGFPITGAYKGAGNEMHFEVSGGEDCWSSKWRTYESPIFQGH